MHCVCRCLGGGGFGQVYTIQRREDGRWFAAKYQKLKDRAVRRCVSSEYRVVLCIFTQKNTSLALIALFK